MQLTHHRHDHHHGEPTEGTPLTGGSSSTAATSASASDTKNVSGAHMVHHMSLMKQETPESDDFAEDKVHAGHTQVTMELKMFLQKHTSRTCLALSALAALVMLSILYAASTSRPHIVSIDNAEEAMLDLGISRSGHRIEMWYQTWGNRQTGVPVLFVHGGPGNAVGDYHNINSKFFDKKRFFVVESDQRGTGRSQPSVWDSWHNMKHYEEISIDLMAEDFEMLREELGIDKWLVFGGSWGSTLSMFYGEQYPERSLGLIVRGVFLNTAPEFDDVYTPRRFIEAGNQKQIREFDYFFELAEREAKDSGEEPLDKYDSERIVKLYNRMILRGDRMAIWVWYVYENNLMEEDPKNLYDFDKIDEKAYGEAMGVAFFESQLFLDGQSKHPYRILERTKNLKENLPAPVHTWVCQGKRDQVCPPKYAQKLVDSLEEAGIPTYAHFIEAPHQCTDPVMQICLKETVEDFYTMYTKGKLGSMS